MRYLSLPLNPVPASRPRVSKWGTYYGKRHKAYRSKALALLNRMRDRDNLHNPLSGRLIVFVLFEVERPRKTILEIPKPDIDNYLKLLLDCCTGFLWDDDSHPRPKTQRRED
jgi:Holliday junction resolvase RusA-like endonuclease